MTATISPLIDSALTTAARDARGLAIDSISAVSNSSNLFLYFHK
jgi:hypothetical protein